MIALIMFAGLVQLLEEEGYLYSVHTRKFLTYKPVSKESRIFLARKDKRPKKFRISELSGGRSGSLKITPVERDVSSLVLDRSGYNADLIQYEEHGGENQTWWLALVPRAMVKLWVAGECIEARSDSYYLKAVACNNFENAPGQYFRWVPVQLERFLRRAGRGREYGRRPWEAPPREYRPQHTRAHEDPNAGYEDVPFSDFEPYGDRPHRRGDYSEDRSGPRRASDCESCRSTCKPRAGSYDMEDDELLERIYEFDKFTAGSLFSY